MSVEMLRSGRAPNEPGGRTSRGSACLARRHSSAARAGGLGAAWRADPRARSRARRPHGSRLSCPAHSVSAEALHVRLDAPRAPRAGRVDGGVRLARGGACTQVRAGALGGQARDQAGLGVVPSLGALAITAARTASEPPSSFAWQFTNSFMGCRPSGHRRRGTARRSLRACSAPGLDGDLVRPSGHVRRRSLPDSSALRRVRRRRLRA
jgi:hypothetical protein